MREHRHRLAFEYAAKHRVWNLRKLVRKVFEEIDPEQLLSMGAPSDEYDEEIRIVAENIDRERGMTGKKDNLDEEDIAHIFALVSHMHFGEWSKPFVVHETDRKMARRFLELEKTKEVTQ
jgi:hypothetical protein